jgi:O-methyltransferase involved in polyketide biosynthesis
VAGELDEREAVAIITEGLLGYLPGEAVDGTWRRFAQTLGGFRHGRYISDIHLGSLATPQLRAAFGLKAAPVPAVARGVRPRRGRRRTAGGAGKPPR